MCHPKVFAAVGFITAIACESDRTDPNAGSPVDHLPMVTLGEQYQEIGVAEGAPEYQLFRVTGALRLASGGIVVANTGTSELRYYDEEGRFQFRAGGSGGGPGEFRNLNGVYQTGPDTILAFDKIGRKSLFNDLGELLGSENVQQGANQFPMDTWLYRRNWVEGVPDNPAARSAAAQSLDRLPVPTKPPGYNFVRIDERGNLWIGNERSEDGTRSLWHVYAASGTPFASVRVPDRLDIVSIGSEEVLGVWRNEDDVELLRIYPLTLPPVRPASSPASIPLTGTLRDSVGLEVVATESRGLLRNMVVAQEVYFADSLRYAPDVSQLTLEVPEYLSIDMVSVSGRGWVAVLVHQQAPGICGLGLGDHVPAGWLEGIPTCAELYADAPDDQQIP